MGLTLGPGLSGWHIECSAISVRELGSIWTSTAAALTTPSPTHTNEIAQSEGLPGPPLVQILFHVLHLNDARGKMSKSKGGFLTVSLLEEKGYDPLVYRLFCLQSHYRKPLTFSFDSLDNAAQAYQKLVQRIAALKADGDPDWKPQHLTRRNSRRPWATTLKHLPGADRAVRRAEADLSDATKRYLIGDFDQVLSLGLLEAAEQASQKPPGRSFPPRRRRD